LVVVVVVVAGATNKWTGDWFGFHIRVRGTALGDKLPAPTTVDVKALLKAYEFDEMMEKAEHSGRGTFDEFCERYKEDPAGAAAEVMGLLDREANSDNKEMSKEAADMLKRVDFEYLLCYRGRFEGLQWHDPLAAAPICCALESVLKYEVVGDQVSVQARFNSDSEEVGRLKRGEVIEVLEADVPRLSRDLGHEGGQPVARMRVQIRDPPSEDNARRFAGWVSADSGLRRLGSETDGELALEGSSGHDVRAVQHSRDPSEAMKSISSLAHTWRLTGLVPTTDFSKKEPKGVDIVDLVTLGTKTMMQNALQVRTYIHICYG
jgi:hypothetical protein